VYVGISYFACTIQSTREGKFQIAAARYDAQYTVDEDLIELMITWCKLTADLTAIQLGVSLFSGRKGSCVNTVRTPPSLELALN